MLYWPIQQPLDGPDLGAYFGAMTLEDHVGDIIRKARRTANVSSEAAAHAAGISANDLDNLEANGQSTAAMNWGPLSALIGLNPKKLEHIAHGWVPAPVDLSRWRELRQLATTQQGNTVNSYLVWDEITRDAAVFDTGWQAEPVLRLVTEHSLHLCHVFITHNHDDHVAALGELRRQYPGLKIHTSATNAPPEERNRPNDFIHLGNLRITHRQTPGHSEDGVTYIIGGFPEDAPHVAVVGDALFAGSIGRGFQSSELLKRSIREQIFSLPPATLICPGHGPVTTMAEQTEFNPFF
jgi:glyoxylase-like metal-dependent hydrolase (beta-lactamase superfamily II)